LHSAPWQLRDVLEMGIGSAEHEMMLNRERGYPEIICGDGDGPFAEQKIDLRVMMRGLLVRQKHRYAGTIEEPLEIGSVYRLLVAGCKTGA